MKLKKYTLSELSINNKGYYGIAAPAIDYSKDKYTYLRITDITDDGHFSKKDLKSVDDINAKKHILKPNDIVFARTGGSTGRNYFYDERDGKNIVYAGFLIKFSINPKLVNPKFIKYYCQSKTYRDWVNSFNTGSTRGNINSKTYENMEILLPPIAQQNFLVNILEKIDEKIDLNNKINENLEQQFKLIYTKSFIENKDKSQYKVQPLSDIFFFQEGPGIRNWQYVTNNGIKFINIRCINDGIIDTTKANMISEEEANGKYSHFLLDDMDIIMSCSGTLGRYAIVTKENLPLCLNTSVIRFKPIICKEDFSYLYGYLISPEFLNKQQKMACGSVQRNFGPTHLNKIEINVPPLKERINFHKKYFELILQLLNNRKENNILSNIKETLLPKLMNGEIDVQQIKN